LDPKIVYCISLLGFLWQRVEFTSTVVMSNYATEWQFHRCALLIGITKSVSYSDVAFSAGFRWWGPGAKVWWEAPHNLLVGDGR